MLSLGRKAVGAPERITCHPRAWLLDTKLTCAASGVETRLPFALFGRSLHTKEATRSDPCPIRLRAWPRPESRWWEWTAPPGSCPSAAARSASTVAQMLAGEEGRVGGG